MASSTRPTRLLLALAASLATPVALAATTPADAAGTADLGVIVTPLGPATAGGTASFSVTITNRGPETVTQATSTGSIDIPLNGVSSATGSCATGRNSVWTCIWPTLPSGATVSYFVSGKVGSTTTSATLSASIFGAADPNLADNRSTATVNVVAAPPDVQLGGSVSDRSPIAGAPVDLKFQVRVSGKSPAPNTILTAELGGLGFVSSDALCSVSGSTVSCVVGNLPGGSSTNMVITAATPSTAGTSVAVSASASSDAGDVNVTNNSTTLALTTK